MSSVEELVATSPRLGLFGGTFDPIHLGHLHVARAAAAFARLDRVVLVPAARSPHKDDATVASGEDRLAYRCRWNATGSVGHWGHIHQRTNQYEAVLTLRPIDDAWKIAKIDLREQQRLESSPAKP